MESRVLSETIMKRVFLILALLSLGASAAHASDDPCFEKAQTQSQLTACSADALKREDAALNQSYKKMQERLKADAATLRLSFATADEARIREGVQRLKRALEAVHA